MLQSGMTDSEPGDASGIGFLSTEVSHDPSGSPKDYTFVPELSSLALGGIHGVPMNATMLVAHLLVTEILILFGINS